MRKFRGTVRTCTACPSQWEGRLEDGRHVYIRLRHGHGSIGIGDTKDEAVAAQDFYRWSDPYNDGFITDWQLRQELFDASVDLAPGVIPDVCGIDHDHPNFGGGCCSVCGEPAGPVARAEADARFESMLASLKSMRSAREEPFEPTAEDKYEQMRQDRDKWRLLATTLAALSLKADETSEDQTS
jgi:hypothetical protein